MIGQFISDRIVDDNQQLAEVAAQKFQARMSLVEARTTLLAATRTLGVGGFTQRAGKIARHVCGARFGKYKPSEILVWLRSEDFQKKFEAALASWKESWEAASSPAAAHVRESQYRACSAFITEKGWDRIADAVESMLAARAQQVLVEDEAGNRRVQSLVDVLDLYFGIPMTAARSAKMTVVGASDCGGLAAPGKGATSPMQFADSAMRLIAGR